MRDTPTPLGLEEYRALRATIRQRGTARVSLFLAGLVAWAAIAAGTAAVSTAPVTTLLPLLVLTAAFEAVYALHVGVERIGRYIQVFFEDEGVGWEHVAMTFGRPRGAAAIDPLFTGVFLVAVVFNLAPLAVAHPTLVEMIAVGGGHALCVLRILVARGAAGRQRAVDLARFEALKRGA